MPGRTPLQVLSFALISAISLSPGLFSFFDPQDFMTFLNPLSRGDSPGEYIVEGWSWQAGAEGSRIGFLRPLTSLSYVPEHLLWGATPWLYRLTSVLIHGAGCVAACSLGRKLGGGGYGAGLLAAATPGAVYAVWLINGRGDILAPLFGLLAVGATISLKEGKMGAGALLPGLFCLLALASKEQGMASVPACLLAYWIWPGSPRKGKTTLLFTGGLLGAAALFLGARYMVFQGIGGYGRIVPFQAMPRHFAALIFQITGAGLIPWKTVRWLFLAVLALPVVLYGASSRPGLRKALLFAAMIPLFGFQSIVGNTCPHYIISPAMVFAVLLGGTAARLLPRRSMVLMVCLALGWMVLGAGEARKLNEIVSPMESAYTAVSRVAPLLDPEPGHPVLTLMDTSVIRDPLLSQAKNIPLYLDHVSGGAAPFETGIWIWDPGTREGVAIRWTGRGWIPGSGTSPEDGALFLLWNGETVEIFSAPDLDM